jgi:hypothetical protein
MRSAMSPSPAPEEPRDASDRPNDPPLVEPGSLRAIGPHFFLSPGQVVSRALRLSGAHKDELIDVAGPDGLAAMITLCREGYERVEFARQATCCGADEQGDLLLIAGPLSAAALADTIRRTARLLRDGGRLVVQLSGAEAEAVVRTALLAAGFETGFSVVDRSAGRLVMHEVHRRAELSRHAPLSA